MGISVDVELPTKIVAKYHRIDGVPSLKWKDDGTGKIELAVSQYLSYEARKDGATPVNKTFKTFDLDKDLTGILRYCLYRAILPLAPEFEGSIPVQDGELGNMLRLLKYLSPAEMSVMIFAMGDILKAQNINPEDYRAWYNALKVDTLSAVGIV